MLTYSQTDARVRLDYRDQVADLSCKIELKPDGRLVWGSAPVPLSAGTKWLLPMMVSDTEVMTRVNFHAEVLEKGVLTSDSAYIMSNRVGSEIGKSSTVSVGGDLTHAKLTYSPFPAESTGLSVVYFAIGMTGYNPVSVESPIGKVTQVGVAKIDNYNSLNGTIVIEGPLTPVATERWLADCNRLASRILDMFSFAQGRLIRWSVRQVQEGDHVLESEFNGPNSSGVPISPVFPHEYGMVLNLAVNRYTQELCDHISLPTAVEWYVHHPHYAELQLTSVVTALEHLISKDKYGKRGPRLVSDERFSPIRAEFERILDAIKPDSDEEAEQIKVMKKKVSELNTSTLLDKITRYLSHHAVPMSGLTTEEVLAAVKARNDIVHRGQYDFKKSEIRLYRHVSFLRELVTRVFLTLLKYEGNYYSYLGGLHTAVFPPSLPRKKTRRQPRNRVATALAGLQDARLPSAKRKFSPIKVSIITRSYINGGGR